MTKNISPPPASHDGDRRPANYGKRHRAAVDSVMNIPPEQHQWGWYFVPQDMPDVRRLVPPTSSESGLRNSALVRFYDERFRTAMIVHPSKATYASAGDAGAIILYLPGASCVHSQGAAMISQLVYFSKKGFPGVAIDHAFHGNGPTDPTFYNLNAYIAWIHSIVQYSKRMYADVPIGLFGRSAGANLALEFAQRYPGEAAFVVAMSGYAPSWADYSDYHIRRMCADETYHLNEKGLDWVKALDPQWTWTDTRAPLRVGSNNVLLLVGDRDQEYPWYRHHIDGDHARDYGVVPPHGNPLYIDWWKDYSSRVGSELAVIPNGAHNLFGGYDQRVIGAAQQSVLDFLERTVPKAGKKYFVGRPFHYDGIIAELPNDVEALLAQAAVLEKSVGRYEENIRGRIQLAIILEALSLHRLTSAERSAQYKDTAAAVLRDAFSKIADQAGYMLLGRPVNDTVVQVAVREAIARHDPVRIVPKTPSVESFIGSVRAHLEAGREDNRLVQAVVRDFHDRQLKATAMIRGDTLAWMSLSGDDEALGAARDFWSRNLGVVSGESSKGKRNTIELRDVATAGERHVVIMPSEGKMVAGDLICARFAELFFEYWPHPTVRRFVNRLDDVSTWHRSAGGRPMFGLKFDYVFDAESISVLTSPSERTEGMTLYLGDLQNLVDVQERNPNDGVFLRRDVSNHISSPAVSVTRLPLAAVEPGIVLGMPSAVVAPKPIGALVR